MRIGESQIQQSEVVAFAWRYNFALISAQIIFLWAFIWQDGRVALVCREARPVLVARAGDQVELSIRSLVRIAIPHIHPLSLL